MRSGSVFALLSKRVLVVLHKLTGAVWLTRFFIFCAQAVSGECCPVSFRIGARFIPADPKGAPRWRRDGTRERLHDALREEVRLTAGRMAQPSAVILDSQSVTTTEKGGQGATTKPRT